MAHLNFFGIDNFRVFKDLNRFDLKPITVLVGTNSSGKSSLSKGILALKSSFEKLQIKDRTSDKSEYSINMWETEKLFFQSELNLGNFTNCVNNKSDNDNISFELPMRFPLLDDLFIIRFTYKKDENALKNGVQSDVKIIHRDSNTQVLHYDSNEGKLKIKFSFLKEQFDEEILKVIEVHKIEAEINELDMGAIVICPLLEMN